MSGTTITLTPTVAPATVLTSTTHLPRLTAQDMLDYLVEDYLGADVSVQTVRAAKEAILNAYMEIATAHRWSYFQGHGRIVLNTTYATGTVAYDHTGGTYERMMTLTDGTWPTWVAAGSIRVGNQTYDVARRISDTVLTLNAQVNPGADLAAGSTYTLYQDTYTLPADFQAQEASFYEVNYGRLAYIPPAAWLAAVRRSDFSGQPYMYSVTGDPKVPGALCLRLIPYPTEALTVDFVYQRLPRALTTLAYTTGTASVTPGSSGTTTIIGSGTAWTAAMNGSTIRLSASTTETPTRLAGANPYTEERNVISVDSATSMVVDQVITTSYAAVKHIVSDPIDVELGAMRAAFYRCAEKQLAIIRQLKDKPNAFEAYKEALIEAKEGDSRDFGHRSSGMGGLWLDKVRYGSQGADV